MNRDEIMKNCIKTHTVHSDLDNAAVSVLENFLKSFGKINTNFAARDKSKEHIIIVIKMVFLNIH